MRLLHAWRLLAQQSLHLWGALLQFVATPFIAVELGPDAYGLVALHLTLTFSLVFLNQGIGVIVSRKFSAIKRNSSLSHDVLYTIECIAIGGGVLLISASLFISPQVSSLIFTNQVLQNDLISKCLVLITILIVMQWLNLVYGNIYHGRSQHIQFARYMAFFAVVQHIGSVLFVFFISDQVNNYFIYQIICWLALTLYNRNCLRAMIGQSAQKSRLKLQSFCRNLTHILAVIFYGLLTVVITQADKFIVSAASGLDTFAAYALCYSVTSVLILLSSVPVVSILVPELSKYISRENNMKAIAIYRNWSQVLVFVAAPISAVFAVFPGQVLRLWLGSLSPLALIATDFLPMYAVGMLFYCFSVLPMAMQLSCGITKLSIIKSLIVAPVYIVFTAYFVSIYRAEAGAWCWLSLNIGYFLIEIPLMNYAIGRRVILNTLSKDIVWKWFICDIIQPLAVTAGVFFFGLLLVPVGFSDLMSMFVALGLVLCSWITMFAFFEGPRNLVKGFMS